MHNQLPDTVIAERESLHASKTVRWTACGTPVQLPWPRERRAAKDKKYLSSSELIFQRVRQ
eukprot:6182492-Pleurochrysis_carterae.AAC.4